jgi:predicted TIM-barrel fold metal-dependent hydrolase
MFFGAVPTIYLLHQYAKNRENPITSWIQTYETWQEEFKERNAIQARLEQQAADDRLLFSTGYPAPPYRTVEVRSLEYVPCFDVA